MSHSSHFPEFDVTKVKGNAPDDIKEFVEGLLRNFMVDSTHGFADSVGARTRVVEVSFSPNPIAPKRQDATVVLEVDVQQDMVNGAGHLHGGCSAYLIDICTSLPLAALIKNNPGVSQSINMVYHAPAKIGTTLRILTTSIARGGRTMTARGEIWDVNNSRLVASGVHMKMIPSQPPARL